jgi:hypothetical protein
MPDLCRYRRAKGILAIGSEDRQAQVRACSGNEDLILRQMIGECMVFAVCQLPREERNAQPVIVIKELDICG